MTDLTATLQHLRLLSDRIDRLQTARTEAQQQLAHRIGIAYRAGDIADIYELAGVHEQFRLNAGTGAGRYWDDHVGVSRNQLRWVFRNRPNGPKGTWTGHVDDDQGPRPAPGAAVVYVLYDDDLNPCYVGSTSRFTARLAQHRNAGKKWSHWTAFPCADRDEAYAVESRLLAEHMPYLNRRRGA